jgi:uncharacterized membrane-anchored protein YitT (DUF2179 family)
MKTDGIQMIKSYAYILIGGFLLALGIVGFLAPNQIATGGTAGLAIVLHHIVEIPIGGLMALINIPLLLVSIKYLGKHFAFKTIFAIGSIAFFIDFLGEVVQIPVFSEEPLLATLYGGVAVGVGLGLIFKGGGSAGGGTIIAKIVTSKIDVKTGSVILMLDSAVIVSAGVVFKSIELALWSMISIYAASKIIDLVLTGKNTQKIVHISSFKSLEKLGQLIIDTLGVGGTIVKGKDLNLKEKKDIIFIVVSRTQISALTNLVQTYDSKARLIVMEASELLGVEK